MIDDELSKKLEQMTKRYSKRAKDIAEKEFGVSIDVVVKIQVSNPQVKQGAKNGGR